MTERSESERAELVALEAELRRATYGKDGPTSPKILGLMVAAADAIRRLAAQDQKPVAFLHETEWGDKSLSFEPAKNHLQWKDTPLYIAPPTAAGWDQAIEAAALTARGFNAAANSSAMRRFVNADLIKEVYERDGAIADAIEALSKPASVESFQSRVQPWMMACFGPEISADRVERNHRFLEEALELVQSNGCTPNEAHQLVDYVYGRPQGEINQEVGGVMVTLAALCLANGIDMHQGGETELARIWTKVEKIRAKQAAKPKHSPLPGPSQPAPVAANASAALQNDLGEMLRALGMPDAAKPKSPHEVFQSALAEMKRQLTDASAEARLREALERELSGNSGQLLDIVASAIRGDGSDLCDGDWVSLSEDQKEGWRGDANRALAAIKEYLTTTPALSAHPHASDCDKQGER